jgi:NADPH-dependent 2,4-dienoyl-CoA reductase/sulfur reductase-like enzyme
MGTGDIGLIMARRMAIQGASVVGVFEIMPWVSGLRRNIAQCLDDFGIPYHLNRLVSELHGKERLEGLTVAEVGPDLKPVPGSEQFVACDTLLLAVGLIPENELSRMAGIDIDASTNGPSVNEFMQTSEECVFAAGNVVVVYDLVDFVSKEGGRAGTFAAMYAAGMLDKPNREISIVPGRNVRLLSPRRLTATEDVTIYLRVARPIERKCRLYADHGLFSKNLRYARPGEMNEVTLTAKKLALLAPNVNSITVGVEAS